MAAVSGRRPNSRLERPGYRQRRTSPIYMGTASVVITIFLYPTCVCFTTLPRVLVSPSVRIHPLDLRWRRRRREGTIPEPDQKKIVDPASNTQEDTPRPQTPYYLALRPYRHKNDSLSNGTSKKANNDNDNETTSTIVQHLSQDIPAHSGMLSVAIENSNTTTITTAMLNTTNGTSLSLNATKEPLVRSHNVSSTTNTSAPINLNSSASMEQLNATINTSLVSTGAGGNATTENTTRQVKNEQGQTPKWPNYLALQINNKPSYNLLKKEPERRPTTTTTSTSTTPMSTINDNSKNENASSLLPPSVGNKKPTDLLTVADLESFILTNRFVRESELTNLVRPASSSSLQFSALNANTAKDKKESRQSTSSRGVALPQPSVLDESSLKWGCTVAAGLGGMVLATSIFPNLWLAGSILGGMYGNTVAKKQNVTSGDNDNASLEQHARGIFESTVLSLGRRLALIYLKIYDKCTILFFMYKTGQLSYEYYKGYAKLDERFAIQDKLDAWNTRFVEGKIAFDKWEKENEVSRKILASLRTFWLVEQQSLKKSRKPRQSKYRLLQVVYDVEYFSRRLFRSLWKAITGGGSSDLQEFLKGLRIEMSESRMNQVGSRIGAVLASLVAVNLIGALFAISPTLLCSLAVLVGVVWPTWVSEFFNRAERFVEETRARGRGEGGSGGKFDKNRYHYYVTENGKKRYYRTATPWFGNKESNNKQTGQQWPWQWQTQKKKTKPQRGLFSKDP